MSITGAAKVAGILGFPVAHSLSPRLHGYWIAQIGLDAAYVPMTVAPEDFGTVVKGLRAAGFAGVNVTVPHKERAFACADRVKPAAEIAGAANVLTFDANGITAENTDGAGLIATLDAAMGEGALRGRRAVVLGAGGMARAALLAVSQMGASEICVLARRREAAQDLIAALAPTLAAKLSCTDFSGWGDAASNAALAINATSAGMGARPPLGLDMEVLPKGAAVFDAVYTPLETDFLRRARACHLTCIDGLTLLLHQAVPSFEAFFGIRPVITAQLRQHMEMALHGV